MGCLGNWELCEPLSLYLKGENFTFNIHTQYTSQIIKGELVLCTLCHQTELGQIDLCKCRQKTKVELQKL